MPHHRSVRTEAALRRDSLRKNANPIVPAREIGYPGVRIPRMRRCILIAIFAAFLSAARADVGQAGDQEDRLSQERLLEWIREWDEFQHISVNNRRVFVSTRSIRAIVKIGPLALNPLVGLMSRKDISFDVFARCYSACDQILAASAKSSVGGIYWSGGAQVKRAGGEDRLYPFGQSDEVLFRERVVMDILRIMESRNK